MPSLRSGHRRTGDRSATLAQRAAGANGRSGAVDLQRRPEALSQALQPAAIHGVCHLIRHAVPVELRAGPGPTTANCRAGCNPGGRLYGHLPRGDWLRELVVCVVAHPGVKGGQLSVHGAGGRHRDRVGVAGRNAGATSVDGRRVHYRGDCAGECEREETAIDESRE